MAWLVLWSLTSYIGNLECVDVRLPEVFALEISGLTLSIFTRKGSEHGGQKVVTLMMLIG